MPPNPMIGHIVKEYIARFPKTPNATLAKTIMKNVPTLFVTTDAARSSIRYYKGKTGKKRKDKLADTQFIQDEDGALCPFENLPEGITSLTDWTPYQISPGKHLILGDIHAPYHVKEALITALKYGKQDKVDTVILNGDIIDFYTLSRFEKDPRARDIKYEVDTVKSILRIIRSNFPDAKILFKSGNHDIRLERYLKVKAPELLGLEILNIRQLLELDKYGIECIPDKNIIKIGLLNLVHGHEFGRSISSPVNPARGLYLRGKAMAMCSHFHRTSDHTEKSMEDDVISCWSTGCLCELKPAYLPINKWNHGFARVNSFENGEFEVYNKKIIKGKVF